RQAIDEYLDASTENGKLIFETKQTYPEVQPIAESIRRISRRSGGTSSRSGSNGFSFFFNGDQLNGRLQCVKSDGFSTNSIFLEELGKPNRTLTISSSEQGRIAFTINSGESGYFLRLRQSEDGQILIQEMDQESLFSGAADDFVTFCIENPNFCSQRLFPTLEFFGINEIPSPYTDESQRIFIKTITPWSATELARIRELTDALDADNYKAREAASKQIQIELDDIGVMLKLVNDQQFRPETRARIRKLIYESLDKDQKNKIASYEKLITNVTSEYLVNLIDLQTDPGNRQVLLQRLRTLQPQSETSKLSDQALLERLGKETAKTNSALPHLTATVDDAENLLNAQGFFGDIKEATGEILRLTPHESSLKIDREHWKASFNGRSVAELSLEIQQLLEKNNLPETWYKPSSRYDLTKASHPQVLFERLGSMHGRPSTNHSASGREGSNRKFDGEEIKGKLIFDQQSGRRPHSGEPQKVIDFNKHPVTIELTEKQGPQRRLLIHEPTAGEMRLLLVGEKPNHVVQLVLKKETAWLQDMRGTNTQFFKAANFQEMQVNEPAYFKEYFFPLLRHIGVKIDPALDPPVDGN
ncbi:MAG: hypothetical protein P8M80_16135, partial [Pirellulaceae bacterium]|nr:hypothetical protein [Pirellulaceae bacterium]